MINTYYILEDGQQAGPYTHSEIMDMRPEPYLMVLSPLADGWQEASNLSEFAQYFESVGIYVPTLQNMAGFGWRLLAYVIDYIVLVLVQLALGALLGVVLLLIGKQEYVANYNSQDISSKFQMILIGTVINILYHAVCEASRMQGSIGKLVLRITVVDANGYKLGFGDAVGRNAGKLLSALVIGVGFLNILWDDHKQAWHDQWAKAYVIRRPA